MTYPFPNPAIAPMERQQVRDGLLLTAERWQRAHDYQRKRQNLHYQSINQPGIVCGLGVRVIPAPEEVAAQYRDNRWVQIQPGIAIDLEGNPIIVPQQINFRIATELKDSEPVTVYLVAQYRDPDRLGESSDREIVQETFRIDEKSRPPNRSDVELCRVLLRSSEQKLLCTPTDIFFPGYGDLDLRYRRQAQAKPQGLVQIAQINSDDEDCSRNFFNLTYLLRAVEDIYPSLKGAETVAQVTWDEDIYPYELLYLTGHQGLSLNNHQLSKLENYLKSGGTLLVDAPAKSTELIQSVQAIAQYLKTPLKSLQEARRDHPLRIKPFLFSALPTVDGTKIQLFSGGGIILAIGNIGGSWGLDEQLQRSRTEIRTAQELGINILHFAWKRKQTINLQSEH
ncbi:conserved hypothetical protein [Hyella patelloides LEGE 07179]|uniref:DUF4159 domain-containing protein n=1 Tax=Hyella patelloides LEGE 07179 TaxID=945734 RepID=A0A563VQJ5_9CYAN|nr:DUF4159 domain-containing protein [Hyella patelloides]VEP13681.1 conserved hypothetical protein [Hyella patelloides LEGE 07179]